MSLHEMTTERDVIVSIVVTLLVVAFIVFWLL
jgi:hypothetical protein